MTQSQSLPLCQIELFPNEKTVMLGAPRFSTTSPSAQHHAGLGNRAGLDLKLLREEHEIRTVPQLAYTVKPSVLRNLGNHFP